MLGGLAERLGMRRSPSGLDTTGVLRLPPEPVRTVSPEPPHEPGPLPEELVAPLYDYEPLGPQYAYLTAGSLPDPRCPDALVFGDPALQSPFPGIGPDGERWRGFALWCACGAGRAAGISLCWNCG